MPISQPIKFQHTFVLILLFLIHHSVQAQSVLLIRPNTEVYDSYKDNKIRKLTLDADTWVNYKGKFGEYFKVSNYFGKGEYYPIGIFEGYININSVLDTVTREEYSALNLPNQPLNNISIPEATNFESPPKATGSPDIDNYFIGMPKTNALATGKSSVNLGNNNYTIVLKFNAQDMLSSIELSGSSEDALAVDGVLKSQIKELESIMNKHYGNPKITKTYPSFLEIEENKIYELINWSVTGKAIILGIGEKNDLYFSSLIIKENL